MKRWTHSSLLKCTRPRMLEMYCSQPSYWIGRLTECLMPSICQFKAILVLDIMSIHHFCEKLRLHLHTLDVKGSHIYAWNLIMPFVPVSYKTRIRLSVFQQLAPISYYNSCSFLFHELILFLSSFHLNFPPFSSQYSCQQKFNEAVNEVYCGKCFAFKCSLAQYK